MNYRRLAVDILNIITNYILNYFCFYFCVDRVYYFVAFRNSGLEVEPTKGEIRIFDCTINQHCLLSVELERVQTFQRKMKVMFFFPSGEVITYINP